MLVHKGGLRAPTHTGPAGARAGAAGVLPSRTVTARALETGAVLQAAATTTSTTSTAAAPPQAAAEAVVAAPAAAAPAAPSISLNYADMVEAGKRPPPRASLPDVKLPDFKLPDFKLPDVKVPDVKLPDVKLPDVKLPDVSGSTAGVSDKAAELASAASKATAGVTDSASKAAAGLTSAVSGATSGVTDTLSSLGAGVGSSVSGLKASLGAGASSITGQVGGVADKVGGTVGTTLSGLKATLDQATSGVTSTVGSGLDQVTATTKATSDAVSAALGSSTAAVQGTLDSISAQAAAVTSQVTAAVDGTTQQVLGALPPPVKDAAVAVGGVVAAAGGQAVAHPKAAAVAALAVGGPAAYRYYKARFGGFAGEVSPLQVAGLLQEDENVFLVDVRSEQQREQEGVPELKLGARYKVAAFPLLAKAVPARVAREAANAEELNLLVNAAYIAGLPQCKGALTKILILDSNGSDKARQLARALTSLGQPLSYLVTGGFRGWAAAELPVLEDAVDYDTSAGAVLGDELEVLAARANEAVSTVTQPSVGLPLAAGSAAAVYAALNIHTTLEFIGVLGVLLTLANKATSYDSPGAALEDAKGALTAASKAVSKLGSIKPPALPKGASLPTLPRALQQGGQQGKQAAAAAAAAVLGGSSSSSGGGGATDVGEETEADLVD